MCTIKYYTDISNDLDILEPSICNLVVGKGNNVQLKWLSTNIELQLRSTYIHKGVHIYVHTASVPLIQVMDV